MMRLLMLAAVGTWPAMIVAASQSLPWLAALAAAVFALIAIGSSATLNRRDSDQSVAGAIQTGGGSLSHHVDGESRNVTGDGAVGRALARDNAALFAIVFGWGAGAIGLGYGLTSLDWQHWWQYAAGMALIGAAVSGYRWLLGQPRSRWADQRALEIARALTGLTGVAALGGLAFLIGSGKLWAGKPDWLANAVFGAGGMTVVAMSYFAVRSVRAGPS